MSFRRFRVNLGGGAGRCRDSGDEEAWGLFGNVPDKIAVFGVPVEDDHGVCPLIDHVGYRTRACRTE